MYMYASIFIRFPRNSMFLFLVVKRAGELQLWFPLVG